MRSSTAVLGLALLWASCCTPVLAQSPFQITSPPAGSVLSLGQPVTVSWTGGDPAWSVDVSLIETTPGLPFAVAAAVATNIPNQGFVAWTFPAAHPFGGPCGHTYVFYVQEVHQLTWTYGPSLTVVCGIPIAIDIKPGSFPNTINPRSHGMLRVAALGTPTFDVTTIDVPTLRFGPSSASPVRFALEDVDGDGDLDLVLRFRTAETGIACGDTAASLSGKTLAEQPVKGVDSVRTVGCPDPAHEEEN